jgi:hypothetical protein
MPKTYSEAERVVIGQRTRERMASPAVREKISRRTREGLERSQQVAAQLAQLQAAWDGVPPIVRRKFLTQILPTCFENLR